MRVVGGGDGVGTAGVRAYVCVYVWKRGGEESLYEEEGEWCSRIVHP